MSCFFRPPSDTCKLSQLRITKPLPSAFRLLASIMIRWKNGHCFKRRRAGQISELLCNSLVFPSLRLPLLQPNILTAKHGDGSQSGPMVTGNPFCHIYGFHVSCSCLQSRRARFQSINVTSEKTVGGQSFGWKLHEIADWLSEAWRVWLANLWPVVSPVKLCLLEVWWLQFLSVSSWKLVLQEHPACRWQSSQNTSQGFSKKFLVSPQWRITWEPKKKIFKKSMEHLGTLKSSGIWSSGTPSPWLSEWPRPNGPTTTIYETMDHGSSLLLQLKLVFGNVILFFRS